MDATTAQMPAHTQFSFDVPRNGGDDEAHATRPCAAERPQPRALPFLVADAGSCDSAPMAEEESEEGYTQAGEKSGPGVDASTMPQRVLHISGDHLQEMGLAEEAQEVAEHEEIVTLTCAPRASDARGRSPCEQHGRADGGADEESEDTTDDLQHPQASSPQRGLQPTGSGAGCSGDREADDSADSSDDGSDDRDEEIGDGCGARRAHAPCGSGSETRKRKRAAGGRGPSCRAGRRVDIEHRETPEPVRKRARAAAAAAGATGSSAALDARDCEHEEGSGVVSRQASANEDMDTDVDADAGEAHSTPTPPRARRTARGARPRGDRARGAGADAGGRITRAQSKRKGGSKSKAPSDGRLPARKRAATNASKTRAGKTRQEGRASQRGRRKSDPKEPAESPEARVQEQHAVSPTAPRRSKGASGTDAGKRGRSRGRNAKPKLTSNDALLKYAARLLALPKDEFQALDGAWISIYEPSLRQQQTFEEGVFPLPWTQVLRDVAARKGVRILGVLPHYARTMKRGSSLKRFAAMPQVVERHRVDEYIAAGVEVQGTRVYVGPASAAGHEELSPFAFLPSDYVRDAFWEGVEKEMAAAAAQHGEGDRESVLQSATSLLSSAAIAEGGNAPSDSGSATESDRDGRATCSSGSSDAEEQASE